MADFFTDLFADVAPLTADIFFAENFGALSFIPVYSDLGGDTCTWKAVYMGDCVFCTLHAEIGGGFFIVCDNIRTENIATFAAVTAAATNMLRAYSDDQFSMLGVA